MVLFIGYISLNVYFLSEEIILVILGEQWIEASSILKILSFLIFFQIFSRFSDTLIRAKNALYKSSIVKFIFLGVNTGGIIIALPYGINAVSWMIAVSAGIHSIMMIFLSIKVMETDWKSFLKTLTPGLKLMFLLSIKNWFLYPIISQNFNLPILVILNVILTDLVIIFLIFKINKSFFGNENLKFLCKIIEKINYIKPKYKQKIISNLKC